jgi:PPM family protein phosphatase
MPYCLIATATRQGTSGDNADSAAVFHMPGTHMSGAAIVDGIGHGPDVVALSNLAAQVAARVGVRKTSILGILAAAELAAAPAADLIDPDAVAVLALTEPGAETSIAWTGDCRAYGWDGDRLVQRTTDHTVGQYLRVNGVPLELAEDHDNWSRTSLGRSSVATVYQVAIDDLLIVLTSDGVHDQMTHDTLETLVREHHADPQALADAIVNAAQDVRDEDEPGGVYRDDATAIVIQVAPGPQA